MEELYFKNMNDTIDYLQDKNKIIQYKLKIIVFRNMILNKLIE